MIVGTSIRISPSRFGTSLNLRNVTSTRRAMKLIYFNRLRTLKHPTLFFFKELTMDLLNDINETISVLEHSKASLDKQGASTIDLAVRIENLDRRRRTLLAQWCLKSFSFNK